MRVNAATDDELNAWRFVTKVDPAVTAFSRRYSSHCRRAYAYSTVPTSMNVVMTITTLPVWKLSSLPSLDQCISQTRAKAVVAVTTAPATLVVIALYSSGRSDPSRFGMVLASDWP